jgi:hypothetical protein
MPFLLDYFVFIDESVEIGAAGQEQPQGLKTSTRHCHQSQNAAEMTRPPWP